MVRSRTLLFLFFCLVLFAGCKHSTAQNEKPCISVTCTSADSISVESKLNQFAKTNKDSLFLSIAKSFIGTPYVGGTLDQSIEENLVVNLSQLDCFTFVESSLALYLTINSQGKNLSNYAQKLQNIRYRGGKNCGYTSRLHYFSDWITDNQKKGIIADKTKEIGGSPTFFAIDFMSTHPTAYKQLKNDSSLVPEIARKEKELAATTFYVVSKENIKEIEPKLNEGMIVGITTNISGLDFSHVGILVRKEGRIHLLHASSDMGEVVISDVPLSEYLARNKRQTGIAVFEIEGR